MSSTYWFQVYEASESDRLGLLIGYYLVTDINGRPQRYGPYSTFEEIKSQLGRTLKAVPAADGQPRFVHELMLWEQANDDAPRRLQDAEDPNQGPVAKDAKERERLAEVAKALYDGRLIRSDAKMEEGRGRWQYALLSVPCPITYQTGDAALTAREQAIANYETEHLYCLETSTADHPCGWYFGDEVEQLHGPYDRPEIARVALSAYVKAEGLDQPSPAARISGTLVGLQVPQDDLQKAVDEEKIRPDSKHLGQWQWLHYRLVRKGASVVVVSDWSAFTYDNPRHALQQFEKTKNAVFDASASVAKAYDAAVDATLPRDDVPMDMNDDDGKIAGLKQPDVSAPAPLQLDVSKFLGDQKSVAERYGDPKTTITPLQEFLDRLPGFDRPRVNGSHVVDLLSLNNRNLEQWFAYVASGATKAEYAVTGYVSIRGTGIKFTGAWPFGCEGGDWSIAYDKVERDATANDPSVADERLRSVQRASHETLISLAILRGLCESAPE